MAMLRRRLLPLALAVPLVGTFLCPAHAETPDAVPPPALGARLEPILPIVPIAGFSTRDFDWTDAARERAVPARLYLPDRAANGPVPLIVFSHGIGGSRMGYTYLGRFWASQGYASLHLQHVGSDRGVWQGNLFGVVGRLQDLVSDALRIDLDLLTAQKPVVRFG